MTHLPPVGILQFGHGAPLGPHGLRWLKIQCVNKFGAIAKSSFDEKVEYADERIDEILDSADTMDTGNRDKSRTLYYPH